MIKRSALTTIVIHKHYVCAFNQVLCYCSAITVFSPSPLCLLSQPLVFNSNKVKNFSDTKFINAIIILLWVRNFHLFKSVIPAFRIGLPICTTSPILSFPVIPVFLAIAQKHTTTINIKQWGCSA